MQDARICRFMQYADGYMHQLIMYTSNKIKYARKLFNYHTVIFNKICKKLEYARRWDVQEEKSLSYDKKWALLAKWDMQDFTLK